MSLCKFPYMRIKSTSSRLSLCIFVRILFDNSTDLNTILSNGSLLPRTLRILISQKIPTEAWLSNIDSTVSVFRGSNFILAYLFLFFFTKSFFYCADVHKNVRFIAASTANCYYVFLFIYIYADNTFWAYHARLFEL